MTKKTAAPLPPIAALAQAIGFACQQAGFKSLPEIIVSLPANPMHGEFSSSICLALAKLNQRSPTDIGQLLIPYLLAAKNLIASANFASPGFLNFTLQPNTYRALLNNITSIGWLALAPMDSTKTVQIEFVSANPTGLLHLGHARHAALGDALARIIAFTGERVVRQYYINDAGTQIDKLGEAVQIRIAQLLGQDRELPVDSYHGHEIKEVANA
ncbi:unnamed protein product [Didymodactylos carnosus]|uniref:Arginyl-tRNA synthetase n=1 Tax=Didymodactylos carnosus TaxID=1234261 RepID=A0A8S2CVK6_9BILA|nr:unnamed protein product [Didymodactylos carnosus]CAF3525896.1 unnamed protein product [Didymodactylos carnosus]